MQKACTLHVKFTGMVLANYPFSSVHTVDIVEKRLTPPNINSREMCAQTMGWGGIRLLHNSSLTSKKYMYIIYEACKSTLYLWEHRLKYTTSFSLHYSLPWIYLAVLDSTALYLGSTWLYTTLYHCSS